METQIREYYCPDCIGTKEDDLCCACFKENYQPVKKTFENEIINKIIREYYCPDCIGTKEDDLCRACFKKKYQPVKEINNEIQKEIINETENEQENSSVDTVNSEKN